MQYLIARDGQQLGQFSEEEIRSGLFEGRYQPTDSAWTEGMGDWLPLGEIMGQGVTRVRGTKGADFGGSFKHLPKRATGIAIAALVLIGAGIIFALSMGAYGKRLTEGLILSQQLGRAVKLHAAENGGKYPGTLDDLVASGKITKATLDQAKNFKPKEWEGDPGFEYFGAGQNSNADGGRPLLRSRCWNSGGKRFLVWNDGTVELNMERSP